MKPEVVSLAVALIVTIIGILAVARQESLQRKEVKRLKSEIVSRDSTIEDRDRSINQWIENYKKVSEENSDLYDKAATAEEKLMQALSERNALKGASDHYRERMEKLEEEVRSMCNAENSYIEEVHSLQKKIVGLKNSVNACKANYSRLKNEFNRYRADSIAVREDDCSQIADLMGSQDIDLHTIRTLIGIIDAIHEKAPVAKLYTPDVFSAIKNGHMPAELCVSEESTEQ